MLQAIAPDTRYLPQRRSMFLEANQRHTNPCPGHRTYLSLSSFRRCLARHCSTLRRRPSYKHGCTCSWAKDFSIAGPKKCDVGNHNILLVYSLPIYLWRLWMAIGVLLTLGVLKSAVPESGLLNLVWDTG